MKKLGVSGNYFVSSTNTDYFLNEHNQFLRDNDEFETLDDCKEKIVKTLNKDFETDCFVLSVAPKYIRLKCKYMHCPY